MYARQLSSAVLALLFAASLQAAEYRAYWVDTFNTPLAAQADVDRIVDAAGRSNANAVFAQVRRRGDSFYLDSKEPPTEAPGLGGFDPLRALIEQAHARGIEVHAFTIVTAVYNADPAARLPADPNHVFLKHIWDRETNAPYTDSRQWATRAASHNRTGTTYEGQRFASEWYIDLGHPDAAAYTIEVLAHLAARYDVDGIHLDRIRYPEAPIDRPSGEPPGMNVGYNATSVARFNERYGRFGEPKSNDPQWDDWRREQVTTFVRNLYVRLKQIRRTIRVSAALITFGAGPAASGSFAGTEPYWRVFQDWERWAREGILDILVPMIYRREHTPSQAAQFDDWVRFSADTAQSTNRLVIAGVAAYLNGIEGTLRQTRRARAAGADGIIFYSFANPSDALTSNPFSLPAPGLPTPLRSLEEFITGLTGGGFELPTLEPVFATQAEPPPIAMPPLRRRAVSSSR